MEFDQNGNLELEFIQFNVMGIIWDCDLLNAK
jgi:hypothetical protein